MYISFAKYLRLIPSKLLVVLFSFQSLLCYTDVSPSLCDKVLTLLGSQTEDIYDSVKILALVHSSLEEATKLVADKHPTVAAEFGASVFRDSKQKVL